MKQINVARKNAKHSEAAAPSEVERVPKKRGKAKKPTASTPSGTPARRMRQKTAS